MEFLGFILVPERFFFKTPQFLPKKKRPEVNPGA